MPARFLAAAVLLSGAVMTGCAGVTSLEGREFALRSDDFRAYVESVFRRQNAVASDIALSLDAPAIADADWQTLEAAESELLAACAGLNEIAARQQSGRSAGGLRAARAAREVPACERATLDAEELYAEIADGL